jgi:hypothetical protein
VIPPTVEFIDPSSFLHLPWRGLFKGDCPPFLS